jgi:hypothetical protein
MNSRYTTSEHEAICMLRARYDIRSEVVAPTSTQPYALDGVYAHAEL